MKKLLLLFALLCLCSTVNAQKKPLGHDIYDGWKNIPTPSVQISENGNFITYEMKPTVGDGVLVIHNTKTGKKREIERGSGAQFFGNQKWLTYKVNPTYAESRKAQLEKVAKDKMPKARTYLLNLATGDTINITQIENPAFLEKAPLIAFLKKETPAKEPAKADSAAVTDLAQPAKDSLPAAAVKSDPKKPKSIGILYLVDIEKKDTVLKISHAEKYSITRDGAKLAYSVKEDSLTTLNFWSKGVAKPVFEPGKATIGKIVFDMENSNQFAFTVLPADTLDKQYALYNVLLPALQPQQIDFTVDGMSYAEGKNSPLQYSKQGSILRFNIAPAPKEPEKDTLLASEKFVLDLWSYTDTLVPTQQMKSPQRFDDSYSAMYNLRENYGRRLAYGPYIGTQIPSTSDNARFFLMTDIGPYERAMAWDLARYQDYYLFWAKENQKELVLTKVAGAVTASPETRWIVYYDTNDRAWHSLDPDTKQTRNLTAHLDVNFYDELYDQGGTPRQAGFAGWARTAGREYLMVYDRYDVWLLDPSGREPARRLTDGRGTKTIFRPILEQPARNQPRSQSETDYVNEQTTLVLTSENEETRESGFWSIAVDKNGAFAKNPVKRVEGPYKYTLVAKAKEADQVIWTRQSYTEYPDLHTSNQTFAKGAKISDANPELKDYLWGTVEMIRWQDKNGKQMKGLLYLPENYDPTQKYPALVYIYEKLTDRLHTFHTPAPSWSIIIPPMYTSNGYAILMPDIDYELGYPGRSALKTVVSAAEELVRRGIADPDRIGINGQSWGGAQLNYIVTQTDAFRCASIGAGVSNMIAGYGNVRGDSGTPRSFLYETGQSRIGGTIWDMPQNFIDNSAVFHLPNVNTPVLLRHSDNDEAVNFAQGLEMFNGLRRLGKPVWLLNYNNGGHNLRDWAMRKDFSVRMQQFFDHYLKDQPLPRWMVEGININERGKELKLELVE